MSAIGPETLVAYHHKALPCAHMKLKVDVAHQLARLRDSPPSGDSGTQVPSILRLCCSWNILVVPCYILCIQLADEKRKRTWRSHTQYLTTLAQK